ncbi:hypothetical protein PSHT_16404 [Puccinia striiformis]|uniref:Uncharacterized protein n=2 Tax=Puccinia striiformis TaxID=27350 RepID=A0A2S4UFE0_9BASI|nr:hypothetical protein PSHT_16404 [Puccinia striiformis]POV96045.1 hypothetical protein PSTT_15878 [Puccinia striiformis]
MPSTAAAPYRGLRGQRLDQAAASLAGSGIRHQADSTASPFAFSRSKTIWALSSSSHKRALRTPQCVCETCLLYCCRASPFLSLPPSCSVRFYKNDLSRCHKTPN